MISKQEAINLAPCNWLITSNDGTNIVATNKVTGQAFSGTLASFNALINTPASLLSDTAEALAGYLANHNLLQEPRYYYESEIYAPATVGNGPLLCGLACWSDWSFHFIGADATNNFSLFIGGNGLSSGQVAANLTPISGAADVTVVVAPGLYRLANSTVFGDMRVVRSGVGAGSCRVIAIGRAN